MNQLYALAAAAAKDPPIIDLDSTVLVQLAIFVITAMVLSRLLFKPYLAVRAMRGAGMEGARDEARAMEEQAAARLADHDQKLAQARARAGAERAKLQGEGVTRDHEITDAARAATQKSLEESRAKLEVDAAAARKQLEPRALEIARAITKKILGREVT